jgi:rhamnosyltransferase
MNYRVGLIVPTLNAGGRWQDWLERANRQSLSPARKLVIDSGSDDHTPELARAHGFEVVSIARQDFNHGATRQTASELLDDCDILVYLTQDALLASSDAVARLVAAFDDPDVALAYGRQLPHESAGPIGAHARLFNYPATGVRKTLADVHRLGIKTAFCSDSFAAYRRSDLLGVGGFAPNVIFGEDTHAATRLLLSGKAIHYVAEADVYHSHDYTMVEDFRRYFDIGVFHAREPWIIAALGTAEGEGFRFLRSEIYYLLRNAPWLLPSALIRVVLKYAAYQLGKSEKRLSQSRKQRLSMNRAFWTADQRSSSSNDT